MTIALDHLIVPVRDRHASAELLARILDVPWSRSGIGPFSPVYVSDSLTLDFVHWSAPDGHVWEALTLSYARR